MIIPRGFAYEWQHPLHGERVYFVVRYLPRGTAVLAEVPTPYKHWAALTNVFVHPSLRGKGLGGGILSALKVWQDLTMTGVVFRATPYVNAGRYALDDESLHEFYERNGFPQCGPWPYHRRAAVSKHLDPLMLESFNTRPGPGAVNHEGAS